MINRKSDIIVHKFTIMAFPGNIHHNSGTKIPVILFFIYLSRSYNRNNIPVYFMKVTGINVFIEIQSFVVVTSFYSQLKINVFFFIEIAPPGVR